MQSAGYGIDVTIDRMYEATMGQGRGSMPLRKAQMHLGAVVSRVNKKTTTGEKIIPGDLKHTYRLTRVSVQHAPI